MSGGFAVPFNRVHLAGREQAQVAEALASRHWAGDGTFTRRCEAALADLVGAERVLLTHSCTAALEMAALLLDLRPGDEIIVPSYTFVTTASAFVLRGAVPVFVDVRADCWNLDETLIEAAITPRTRAIVPVHYGGVACDMDTIQAIAAAHGLSVVEDAAQAIGASYRDKSLGGMGTLGTLSFHATKNIVSGEGGALLVNDPRLVHRAEIVREKGTDRSLFLRGEVDKYSWCALGSSYLPSDLIAAILSAQLEVVDAVTDSRRALWKGYHTALAPLASKERLRRPTIPPHCRHNGHLYAVELPVRVDRAALIASMARAGVQAVSHYQPLHLSQAGRRFGRASGRLPVTERISAQLLRLPLWPDMRQGDLARVVEALEHGLRECGA